MTKELTCIVCPVGCRLLVLDEEGSIKVKNNNCTRGIDYAVKEITSPERVVPSTVKIKGSFLKRLPVKTDKAVAKELIFEIMKEINKVEVTAPIKLGDIIIENILNTKANIVATRTMQKNIE